MRVIDFGVDKYGLNAYIYDSTNDGTINYDRVLFVPDQGWRAAVADLAEGELGDVKVKIVGGSLDGLTAGFLHQGGAAVRRTCRRSDCSTRR